MEQPGQGVAIIGGGVIGLSIALECALAGFRVTVLERGRAMEEASWAAAGMLAVDDPENAPELHPLSRLSRALYPEFLACVQRRSGLAVPLRTEETLQAIPLGNRRIEGTPAKLTLPALKTDRFGWIALREASLDPRDLCAALPLAATRAGVALREHAAVQAVFPAGRRVAMQLAGGERLTADHCIVAAGAWSGKMRLSGEAAVPVAPRKGQMIEITLAEPALPVVVRTPELYLVPRGDGRVVIGATVEYAGFDRTIDKDAGERLWQAAAALWPPILKGRITGQWTGLRPGFQPGIHDGLPVLGRAPGVSGNAWLATAHFRNGVLLAPGTARVLRELLEGREPSVPLAAFTPERFGAEVAPPLLPAG